MLIIHGWGVRDIIEEPKNVGCANGGQESLNIVAGGSQKFLALNIKSTR